MKRRNVYCIILTVRAAYVYVCVCVQPVRIRAITFLTWMDLMIFSRKVYNDENDVSVLHDKISQLFDITDYHDKSMYRLQELCR